MDERYFATLLALYGVEHESYRPGLLTYVDWSMQTLGGHPRDFTPDDVTPQLLQVQHLFLSVCILTPAEPLNRAILKLLIILGVVLLDVYRVNLACWVRHCLISCLALMSDSVIGCAPFPACKASHI